MKSATFSKIFLALFLLNQTLHAQSPSRVELRSFSSTALGVTKNYRVYLPAGYDNSTERYPVVYFFRGHEDEWFEPAAPGRVGGRTLKNVADDLVATGQIGKMIIVCPSTADANLSVLSFGVNMLRPNAAVAGIGTGRFEDYIVQDLILHIDATLRTIPDQAHRAIDGFSAGGYTATTLSLKHPDLFASVGSYDAFVMWYNLDDPSIPGANADDPILFGNPYYDDLLSPAFDKPRNIPFMLLHSAPNILRAVDATQLANIQRMRFHLSTASSDIVGGTSRNLHLISILLEKGIRNSFNNPILAPNAEHDYGFADLHASTSLVRHWQAFKGYRLNAPLVVDFGAVTPGKKDTAEVMLFNYSTSPLTISSAGNLSGDFNLLPFPALPKILLGRYDALNLKMVFNPSGHRAFVDTLIIASSDNDNPRTRVVLRGKGFLLGQAQAGIAYVTSGTTSQLLSVQRTTGTATAIGLTGTSVVRGLAIHPMTKEIYATVPGNTTTKLYRLSSQYGEALEVKNIYNRGVGYGTYNDVGELKGIAFQPDGVLLGVATSGRLYRINITTGEATLIVPSGVPNLGLAFSPSTGKLYASLRDGIYTINLNNGTVNLIGRTGFGGSTPGIAFGPDGTLYGITSANNFIRIDTTNGAGTLIGPTGFSDLTALTMRTDLPTVNVDDAKQSTLPEVYRLNQNYPNPFNPATTIAYHLPRAGQVKLIVYNLSGQRVRTLVDAPQAAGRFQINWDGKDEAGNGAASGVYLYRLEAENFAETKKMILLR